MTDWRVDLCKRSYAAFDGLDLDAMLPLYHRDCEWDFGDLAAAAGTRTYRGHAGLRALVRDLRSVFPDWHPRIEEIRERSDGALLLHYVAVATARDGGIQTELRGAQVATFSEGRILRIEQTPFPPPGWDDAAPLD